MKNFYKIIFIFVVFLSTIALISHSGLDIYVASLFHDSAYDPPWPYFNKKIVAFIYHKGVFLPNLVAIICLILLLLSFFIKIFNRYRKQAIFALALYMLAPALLVQTSKDYWGRPRPGEVEIFGGKYQYKTPFQPNFKLVKYKKNDAKSFPSGHAAVGFYMLVLYFVFKQKRYFVLGLLYGSIMGFVRIIQGGHFLSDVVSSFFVVYICGIILSLFFSRGVYEQKKCNNNGCSRA